MATHSSILAWRIHEQRSLMGKELDMIEQLTHTHTHTHTHIYIYTSLVASLVAQRLKRLPSMQETWV